MFDGGFGAEFVGAREAIGRLPMATGQWPVPPGRVGVLMRELKTSIGGCAAAGAVALSRAPEEWDGERPHRKVVE